MNPSHPSFPPVKAIRAIVILCVLAYALPAFGGSDFADWVVYNFGLIPAFVTLPAIAGHEMAIPAELTLLTAAFLHGSVFHIGMNMLFLWVIGRPVEWVLGPGRFLLLYVGCTLAASLCQVVSEPRSAIPVIGASGAISGIFAAYVVMFSRTSVRDRTIAGVPVSGEILRLAWTAAAWIGLQLAVGYVFNVPGAGGVAIWAHVGGFVAGLLLIFPIGRSLPDRRRSQHPS